MNFFIVHLLKFVKFINSNSFFKNFDVFKYKYERGWILNLLKYGIKDTIDYTLCTKAYVYKTLMTYYDCSLSDDSTKV